MTAPLNTQPQAPTETAQEMTIPLREQVIVITDAAGAIVTTTVVEAPAEEQAHE